MSKHLNPSGKALFGLLLAAVLFAPGLLPRHAGARIAEPDQAFLDREIPAAAALAAQAVPGVTGPEEALNLVRQILDRRQTALAGLGTTLSLTSFDGIETMDRYDREVLLALDAVAGAGVETDPTLPPEAQAVRFSEVMGTPPDLGDKPVAFMVVELAEILTTTVDLLANDPTAPAPGPAKLALRFLFNATTAYRTVQDDFLVASKAEAFRQSSVILRMRCPRDGATYTVNTMKNKVGATGEISTLYYLECPVCHIPEAVEFPLELATRLNRASERQRLKTPPKPHRPSEGLKP